MKTKGHRGSICVSPSVASGTRRNVTFHIDKHVAIVMALGVVSTAVVQQRTASSSSSNGSSAYSIGYKYNSNGACYAEGKRTLRLRDEYYATGDTITVCLDLVANTVAFRKNGTEGKARRTSPIASRSISTTCFLLSFKCL